jgi:hypothetical protein
MNARQVLAIVCLSALPMSAAAQSRDPIAGAWEVVSVKDLDTGVVSQAASGTGPSAGTPLHVIYADGHYTQFAAAKGRPKLTTPREEMTREQLAERSRMQGQYGTYKVTGNTVVRNVVSAANPNIEGIESKSEFKVVGDTLTTTDVAALGPSQGHKVETTYKRLRSRSAS